MTLIEKEIKLQPMTVGKIEELAKYYQTTEGYDLIQAVIKHQGQIFIGYPNGYRQKVTLKTKKENKN